MNGATLICAIIGHLVGDYLLQTDWMALNKKRSSFPCAIHCALWTAAVCAMSGWTGWLVVSILFLTHFLQDRTRIITWWMRIPWKDQSQFMKCDEYDESRGVIFPGCGPWSVIVVDNVWHIVTIWAVWRFLA